MVLALSAIDPWMAASWVAAPWMADSWMTASWMTTLLTLNKPKT